MALSLEDTVLLMGVEALKADIPIDKERLGWMNEAYQQIKSYEGRWIQVKDIDEALSALGEGMEIPDPGHLGKRFNGQLLSLRPMKPSEDGRRALDESGRKRGWSPVHADRLAVYLLADEKGSALYLGVSFPYSVDGMPYHELTPMVRMAYRK